MTPVEIDTLKRYVAAFVAYQLAGREPERQALDKAERAMDALSHPMFK